MIPSRFHDGPGWRSFTTWQEQAEHCLRQSHILPDGERLYLCDGNTLPDSLRTETAYGYCSPLLDLMLRPHIVDWSGRGVAAVIFPQHFDSIERLVGTIAHEFCHWLEYAVVCAHVGMVELLTHTPENMRPALRESATVTLDSFDVDTNTSESTRNMHNVVWHWFVVNAVYRLWEYGGIANAHGVISFGDDYGLSSKHEYMKAAEHLPAELAGEPMLRIAGRVPPAVLSLFEKDMKKCPT